MKTCKQFDNNLIICENSIYARNKLNELKEIEYVNITGIKRTHNSIRIVYTQWKRGFCFEIPFNYTDQLNKAFKVLERHIKLCFVVVDYNTSKPTEYRWWSELFSQFKNWLMNTPQLTKEN